MLIYISYLKIIAFMLLTFFFQSKLDCKFLFYQDHSIKDEPFVIGTWPQAGFFAAFLAVLNNLDYCERERKIPIVFWDSQSVYFDNSQITKCPNAWEYYFEPLFPVHDFNELNNVHRNYGSPDGFTIWSNEHPHVSCKQALFADRLIKKYIKVKPYILDIVNDFYKKNMENFIIIGIHLRGTDKGTEIRPIATQMILEKAQDYARTLNQPYKYLIASDEWNLINIALETLKDAPVIMYDTAERAFDHYSPVHFFPSLNNQSLKLGEDVLVEVLLLSKSSFFIHTVSCVSTAVLFFNPELNHVLCYEGAGCEDRRNYYWRNDKI